MKKRLFAFLISLVMVMICAAPVYAADSVVSETEEPFCVYSRTYEEIKDADTLIRLALDNYEEKASEISLFSTEEEDDYLQVSQLLSEKHYSDGTEEKSYAHTSFVFLDENGVPMDAARAYQEIKADHEKYDYEDNVYGYQTIYTTEWFDFDIAPFSAIYIRFDSITAEAVFSSSDVICTEIFQKYDVVEDQLSVDSKYREKTTYSPQSGRSYELVTGDSSVYHITSQSILPQNGVIIVAVFETSVGTSIDIVTTSDTFYNETWG